MAESENSSETFGTHAPGTPDSQWTAIIGNGVTTGFQFQFYGDGKLEYPLFNTLSQLESDDPAVADKVKQELLYSPPSASQMSFPLFYLMGCRELFDLTLPKFQLGHMVWNMGQDPCKSGLTNPYDAARWEIHKTPIFYFQGLLDINSPVENTVYHVQVNKDVPRSVVLFPKWGHSMMGTTAIDCKEGIWSAIFNGSWGLGEALQGCQAPHRWNVYPPGAAP